MAGDDPGLIYSVAVSERLKRSRAWLALALVLAASLVIAACGDDENEGGSGGGTTAAETAPQSDRAAERGFLEAMVPHHESAIEMAELAVERAEAPEIKKLAEAIRDAQQPEIEQIEKIHERLFGSALKPNMAGHEALGLTAEEAGMAGHEDAMKMLETADPFDRAFIDEMVPHHEGAVKMAQAVLTKTQDAELKKLAQAIIDAQTREITQMNEFRTKNYGGPVPEKDEGDGGGHGGDSMEEGH
jgi:uncharacterized protein (DUF305 family)